MIKTVYRVVLEVESDVLNQTQIVMRVANKLVPDRKTMQIGEDLTFRQIDITELPVDGPSIPSPEIR